MNESLKWFAGLILLLSMELWAGRQQLTKNHVSLAPVGTEEQTMFAVSVDNAEDDDQAIVRICFWQSVAGIESKLVLCKTSVIPVFPGVQSATDSYPVNRKDLQSVTVTVVRPIAQEKFPYKEVQP